MGEPQIESIDAIMAKSFPQKESTKEKTEDKSTSVSSTDDNRTVVEGSTILTRTQEKIEEHQNRYKSIGQTKLGDAERLAKLTLNAEIDEFLRTWLIEGLIVEKYAPWVAKCCHSLGIVRANELAIAARSGNKPAFLFSALLKGAVNLQAKQAYYTER